MFSYFLCEKQILLPKEAWPIGPRGKYATLSEPLPRNILKIQTWHCAIWCFLSINSCFTTPISSSYVLISFVLYLPSLDRK